MVVVVPSSTPPATPARIPPRRCSKGRVALSCERRRGSQTSLAVARLAQAVRARISSRLLRDRRALARSLAIGSPSSTSSSSSSALAPPEERERERGTAQGYTLSERAQ